MRPPRTRFFSSRAVAAALLLLASSASGWVTVTANPQAAGRPTSIALDPVAGDILSAGYYYGGGLSQFAEQFAVVRIKSKGGSGKIYHVNGGTCASVVTDAAGNGYAGGSLFVPLGTAAAVVKLDTRNREVWRYTSAPSTGPYQFPTASDVALDPAGDVVAAIGDSLYYGNFFGAVKLDGADGSPLWTYTDASTATDGYAGGATSVAVDAAGDVLLIGYSAPDQSHYSFWAVKLAGSDGHVLWRRPNGSPTESDTMRVDANGDMVVGSVSVSKYSGVDGTELWHHVPTGYSLETIALFPNGDVAGVGLTDLRDLAVVKLAGGDGTDQWIYTLDGHGHDGYYSYFNGVTVDPAGNVVAVGSRDAFSGYGARSNFLVVNVRGDTGEQRWIEAVDSYFEPNEADVVAAGGGGRIFVAGHASGFATVGLSETIAGQSLTVNDPGAPAARALAFASKDPYVQAPSPDTEGDPTLHGATLELINPTTGERDSFPLPAQNWKVKTLKPNLNPPFRHPPFPGVFKYTYADPSMTSGPCTTLTLSSSKAKGLLTGSCAGASIAFSLDEASQGSLAVKLTVGGDAFHYCMLFGGTVSVDHPGAFTAVAAPAPPACPE